MGYFDNQGASPTKVTWKNPSVTPEDQRQDGGWYYNPESGYVERWWSGDGGGQSQGGDPVDNYLDQQTQALTSIFDTKNQSIENYLKDNPFAWDDEWLKDTRDTITQQADLEPYFKEKLSNYIEDVNVQKTRAQEDEATMLKELDRQQKYFLQENAMAYQQARESALEGLSSKGMVGEGAGQRQANMGDIGNEEKVTNYTSQQDLKRQQAQLGTSRLLEDLVRGQTRFETDLNREKDLWIEQELQNRKGDQYNYWQAGLAKSGGQVTPNLNLYTG